MTTETMEPETEAGNDRPETEAAAPPVTITVQNLSTVLTDDEAKQIVEALNTQGTRDYNPSCWVTQGLAVAVGSVEFVEKGAALPPGSWHIELLDTSDQPGALGYHEDQAFKKDTPEGKPEKASTHSSRGLRADAPELPLAKVFCKTSKEDGVDPGEVASHEMLEALVDPQVVKNVRTVTKPSEGRIYIVEVGDPVQSTGYLIGSVTVANFALPAYFGLEQKVNPKQYDFRAILKGQVPAMTPGGYLSYAPEGEPENWKQEMGSPAASSGV